jgi:hypothetical protein
MPLRYIKRPLPIFTHKVIIVACWEYSGHATLQSRAREHWNAFNGSTFRSVDAPTYNASQVFDPFPFPEATPDLTIAGEKYHDFRGA